jgi:signal transduction histidine kinase
VTTPLPRRLAAVLTGPAGDLLLAAAVIAGTVIAVYLSGGQSLWSGAAAVGVLVWASGCVALARSVPLVAAPLLSLALFASGWMTGTAASIATGIVMVPVAVLVYRAATRMTLRWSVATTAMVVVGWQAGAFLADGFAAFNPTFFFVPIGACVVGVLVRASARATERLNAQTRELLAAQQQYVQESIRAERVRIARELHDVVAHCVSAMVVQANAGQKLATRDPELAAQAFDHISDSAKQAASEIVRLVALLDPASDDPTPDAPAWRTRSIDELIVRARDTGLDVAYRPLVPTGPLDIRVNDVAYAVAYAVVQEGLTNALKHAPGARIDVRLHSDAGRLRVDVDNTAARTSGLGLDTAGGRNGLRGLRERVVDCGGTLVAGPDLHGGWRVAADLPTTVG